MSQSLIANQQLREASAEMERRLRAGEACSAEEFLARSPKLAADADAALDLIYAEFVARAHAAESALMDEFLRRYPRWRSELGRQFAFHRYASDEWGAVPRPTGHTVIGNPEAVSGRFIIGDELGRGGAGVVYRAWEEDPGRFVALKMILAGPYAGPVELARFRLEAEAVARLQHPNIVPLYSVGHDDGRRWLAFEYVSGGNLTQALADGPLHPRRAAEVVAALARAIHYAHSRGVLHRDLKPANVLLTEDGTPKLIDFSLAKLMENGSNDSTLTNDGQPIGTPSYMAPCQLVGRSAEIGPRTDVYGLGAILYECLAGQPPLKGDSALDTLRLVESVRPDPPSLLNDRVPNGLEAICLKCLRKRSNRRYSSAADLADALQAWLDCQAPLPDAPGP